MSMVRCCDCGKPMDTDSPGSIYAFREDLYCMTCFDKFEKCGLCDGEGVGCESRNVFQQCSQCKGTGIAEPAP